MVAITSGSDSDSSSPSTRSGSSFGSNAAADRFLENLPSVETIHERVAAKIDGMTYRDDSGKAQPFVCGICDEFIAIESDLKQMSLKTLQSNKVRPFLEWNSYPDNRASHDSRDGPRSASSKPS